MAVDVVECGKARRAARKYFEEALEELSTTMELDAVELLRLSGMAQGAADLLSLASYYASGANIKKGPGSR